MARQYNILGYDKDGYKQDGFNRNGFDRDGYDRLGYDTEGYDRKGYNAVGYDRVGFNQLGFNSKGFNQKGYDIDGYDADGYDTDGFDLNRYNRNGYDLRGYDVEGYNRRGYDKNGYDRSGYNSSGWDRKGFDRAGYDKNGLDMYGYNRKGFNLNHFTISGSLFNKGVDYEGYNFDGFNVEGYDREGYDTEGYDRHEYNREGYTKYGYNEEGFYLNGGRYDEDGLDANGNNRKGEKCVTREGIKKVDSHQPLKKKQKGDYIYSDRDYEIDGHNARGFKQDSNINKNGTLYDQNGFGADGIHYISHTRYYEGYDCYGFDDEGYDRAGYDGKYGEGFNRKGWNREGNNKIGYIYDSEGYDVHGINKFGLSRTGFDKKGYGILGLDAKGYNLFLCKDGISLIGEELLNYDCEGINLYTLKDSYGFYRDGFNEAGYNRIGFDRKGFDVDGFNKNGFDKNGFDRDGFNVKGFDQAGYGRDGYDAAGFDRDGYDNEGYNRDSFNKNGFARNGFNKDGYDHNGYDWGGYDKEGFDRSGLDRVGNTRKEVKQRIQRAMMKPDLSIGMIVYHKKLGRGEIVSFSCNKTIINIDFDDADSISSIHSDRFWESISFGDFSNKVERARFISEKEDAKERKYFENTCNYIDKYSSETLWREAQRESEKSSYTACYMENGEMAYEIKGKDPNLIFTEKIQMKKRSPYFCHIDYATDSNLYIGKEGYPEYIVDWADKRASYYYQYQIYIGNPKMNLKLVRNIDIENGYYLGFRDSYNVDQCVKQHKNISQDKYLAKIIAANREDKKIHDIIETIQNNQYNIITKEKNKNLLVLGCAGSGKTMILLHKIRYMKYNNSSLDMKKVLVISPTNLLDRESMELSKTLQISDVQQYTMSKLIYSIVQGMLKQRGYISDFVEIDDYENNQTAYSVRSSSELFVIANNLRIKTIAGKDHIVFCDTEEHKLDDWVQEYEKLKFNDRPLTEMFEAYRRTRSIFRNYSSEAICRIIMRATRMFEKVPSIVKSISFLEFLVQNECFASREQKKKRPSFFYTMELSQKVDMVFLKEYLAVPQCTSMLAVLQYIELFYQGTLGEEKAKYILDEWRQLTENDIKEQIRILTKEKECLELIPREIEVLSFLREKGYFVAIEIEGTLSDKEVLDCGKDMITLFNDIKWVSENQDPIAILQAYDVLKIRYQRFLKFKSSGSDLSYLCEMVVDELELERNKCSSSVRVNKNQIFEICYILSYLFNERCENKQYIYIDEFQDFPKDLLLFIKEYYYNSAFNFFGDFNQCINNSGMTRDNSHELMPYKFEKHIIMENYRNGREITLYVNKRFGMNMMVVGLPGKVETRNDILLTPLRKGDRAAIIVANNEIAGKVYTQLKKGEFSELVSNYSETNAIIRNTYTVLPVIMAKGLEFERVVAYETKMSDNQKYVACTRAINYLQVVTLEV